MQVDKTGGCRCPLACRRFPYTSWGFWPKMLGRAVKRIYILVILTTAVDPDGAKAGTQDGDTPSARCLPPCVTDPRVIACHAPPRISVIARPATRSALLFRRAKPSLEFWRAVALTIVDRDNHPTTSRYGTTRSGDGESLMLEYAGDDAIGGRFPGPRSPSIRLMPAGWW